jgi:hypothetical protein
MNGDEARMGPRDPGARSLAFMDRTLQSGEQALAEFPDATRHARDAGKELRGGNGKKWWCASFQTMHTTLGS